MGPQTPLALKLKQLCPALGLTRTRTHHLLVVINNCIPLVVPHVIELVSQMGFGTAITKNSFGLVLEAGIHTKETVGVTVHGQLTHGSQFPLTLIGGTLTVAVSGPQAIVTVPITLPAQPLSSIRPSQSSQFRHVRWTESLRQRFSIGSKSGLVCVPKHSQ